MNLHKGAFRLWVVASIIWFIAVGYFAYDGVIIPAQRSAAYQTERAYADHLKKKQDDCFNKLKDATKTNPFNCFNANTTEPDGKPDDWVPGRQAAQWRWSEFLPYVLYGFTFPLGAIAAWFIGLWIVRGFREPQV